MNWRIGIAVALAIAGGWGLHSRAVSKVEERSYDAGKDFIQKQWDEAREQAQQVAATEEKKHREKEQTNATNVITAQSTRAQTVRHDTKLVADLRAERDGLRADLAKALAPRRCDVSSPSPDASANRAAAVEAVFADMERAGAEMAGSASGHAADSLMYQQSWPH